MTCINKLFFMFLVSVHPGIKGCCKWQFPKKSDDQIGEFVFCSTPANLQATGLETPRGCNARPMFQRDRLVVSLNHIVTIF